MKLTVAVFLATGRNSEFIVAPYAPFLCFVTFCRDAKFLLGGGSVTEFIFPFWFRSCLCFSHCLFTY